MPQRPFRPQSSDPHVSQPLERLTREPQTPATSSDRVNHRSPTTPAETYLQLQSVLHKYSMDKCTTFKFKMEKCHDNVGRREDLVIGKCIRVDITKYSELLHALNVPKTGSNFPLYMSLGTYTYGEGETNTGLNIFFVYSVEAENKGWQMVFAKSNQQGWESVNRWRAKTSSGTFPLGKQDWRNCPDGDCPVKAVAQEEIICEMEITIIKTGSDKQILVLDLYAPEEAPAPLSLSLYELEEEVDKRSKRQFIQGWKEEDDEGGGLTDEERADAAAAATAAAQLYEQQKEWTAQLAAAQKEKPQSDAEAAALLAEGQTLGGKQKAISELIAGRP